MNQHEPMASLVAKEQAAEKNHPSHENHAPQPGDYPMPPKKLFFGVVILLAGLVAFGLYGHWQQDAAANETQEETVNFVPTVRTATAVALTKPVDLVLPGQTRAFDAASIFARATGYIADRRVDIGSHVKQGDLLVRIAAPDLDRQLDQSIAQLDQVNAALQQARALVSQGEANVKLAQLNLDRSNALVHKGFDTVQNNDTQSANTVSQQATLETVRAGVSVAEANVKAQQATVNRLRTLTEFEQVTAPFDGVITRRNVDIGDLVNADTGGGTPMFTMENDNVLRVSVDIPQSASIGIHDGLEAKVMVPQLPGQVFTGKVSRSSVALLSASRTLTTEVDVPNPDKRLRAGLFVNVVFSMPREAPSVVVPAEALIFNHAGLQVAVVDGDNKVSLKPISINRDFGKTVELRDGLAGGDRIILSPPAILHDGSKVKVAAEAPQSAPPQPTSPQKAEK
jgi:HlyD family secretion protein